MTDTPLIRAARALVKALDESGDLASLQEWSPERFEQFSGRREGGWVYADGAFKPETLARAVLEAVREPSDHMLSDGAFQIFKGERISSDDLDSAKRVWRAMMKAAISE